MPNTQPATNRDVTYTGSGPPGQSYGYGDSLMPFGQLQLPFGMPMGMPMGMQGMSPWTPGMSPGMPGMPMGPGPSGMWTGPPAAPPPQSPLQSLMAPPLDAMSMPGFMPQGPLGPPGPPMPPPQSMTPFAPPGNYAPPSVPGGWVPGQYGVPPGPWANEIPPPIPMGP